MSLGSFINKNKLLAIIIGIAGVSVLVAGLAFAIDGARYAAYEAKYNKEVDTIQGEYPALPQRVYMDNDFVKYNAEGSKITKKKSNFRKGYTFYAKDARIAPLSEDTAEEYKVLDDSFLGECITGLDRKGGAIIFDIYAEKHGYSDIAIAMRSNRYDENKVYYDLENITDYIKIQINGLDVQTVKMPLKAEGDFQYVVLRNTNLITGKNTLTLTTSAYNAFGNKNQILYVMPDIRNVTLFTNVNVYMPSYDIDLGDIKTSYRLVDLPDLKTVKCTKKIGNPNDPDNYKEEEFDTRKLKATIDYKKNKLSIFASPKDYKEIPITIDSSAGSNTAQGELNGQQATVVVNSESQATITLNGASCVAKISLSGKGLARINMIEKISGDDSVFSAFPVNYGLEEKDNILTLAFIKYFMSSTKANSNTNGGTSQTGNTYFAISCEEYLTAFWNWTYSGDECLTLKCEYQINAEETHITLLKETAHSRDEWQYLSTKEFDVTSISASEIPESLFSRLVLY